MILPELPAEAAPLLLALQPAFTQPTLRRFALLMAAALLTTGRRTVANLLRTLGTLAGGHRTSYQRVLSAARWSGLRLACACCRFVLRRFAPAGRVTLVGDDTVEGHPGRKVYGKARHRDPVRSSHGYTAWRYGHKWVVLAVLVRFPFATPAVGPAGAGRPVPLGGGQPVPRPPAPHPGPAHVPAAAAACCSAPRPLASCSSATPATARTRSPASPTATATGWPGQQAAPRRQPVRAAPAVRRQGPAACQRCPACPSPARPSSRPGACGGGPSAGTAAARVGSGRTGGAGHWYKSGAGLVPIRWVFVRDEGGTHRDEYFFSTDLALAPEAVIGHYTGRWNIETTFQELRACLGLETTRGWCRAPCCARRRACSACIRWSPCCTTALPESKRGGAVAWPGKDGTTFSDALAAVRRWLWSEWVFPQAEGGTAVEKLPEPIREIILSALAPAA